MSPTTLEQRVERLEHIVAELRGGVPCEPGRNEWKTTIGTISTAPESREILDEAMRLRECERQRREAARI
jgi:hypothetical protein